MSADAWQECPRCKSRDDIGYRGNEFREDYEIGLVEGGVVEVTYRGECQRCGLLLQFTSEHPIPDLVNEPIGGTLDRTWGTVPAGWFVQTPKGDWLEVDYTLRSGAHQSVGLRIGGKVATFPRDPAGPVKARRGSLSPRDRDEALDSLEEAFTTAILRDEPPGMS